MCYLFLCLISFVFYLFHVLFLCVSIVGEISFKGNVVLSGVTRHPEMGGGTRGGMQ